VAPDADQEIHGHQRDFPEHVEQEQVLRCEYAGEAKFQQQHEGEELLAAALNRVPGNQDADGCEERGQDQQPQAQSVERYVVVNVGRGHPDDVGDELLAGADDLVLKGEP
jgi:hypothetical protein